MLTKPLRLSVVSDVHLGHRKNEAQFIIANLNKHISCDAHLSQIDLLVLAGDVFDDLLGLNSEYVPPIKAWVARLLRLCYKYGVVVVVLEGTPSHDRLQSKVFESINDIHQQRNGSGIELYYVQELSILHIAKFGIDCLLVPDECNHLTEVTLEQVRGLMAEKGLEKVDFAFMHGQFTYQLPAHIKNMPRHDEASYLALVRYLIFIGHVHIPSEYDRIYVQGSFDRLSQGEEHAKGFYTAIVQPDGHREVTFIENVGARKFVTVDCYYDEVEENIKLVDTAVQDLPNQSYVRIRTNYGNPMQYNLATLTARWPLLNWSTKVEDKEVKEVTESIVPEFANYVPITIDRHNLMSLVMGRLEKLGLDAAIMAKCASNLGDMQRL